jgi:hypothetical protein
MRLYLDNCCFNRPFDDQNQLKIKLEAERFVSLIIKDPFDYTEWQRDLFNNLSVRELSSLAMKEYKTEF